VLSTPIYIAGSALDLAMQIVCRGLCASKYGSNMEISGLLLGREIGDGLLITSAITGPQASTELESRLDDNFVASVATEMMTGRMRDRIVGMFHSHPGIGIFMSSQDAQTLANFQRLYPSFLMMVIDPLRLEKFRFFRYDYETMSVRTIVVQVVEWPDRFRE